MNSPLFVGETARPWLASIDPRLKVVWVVGVSVVAVCIDGLVPLAVLTLAAAAVASGLRLSSRGWLVIASLLGLIAWTTTLTQGFFYPTMPDSPRWTLVEPRSLGGYAFPGIAITTEGLRYGALQSLRLLSTALAGFTLCLSASPERILAALVRLRLPTTLAFMAMAGLRFLPLLIDEVRIVRQARHLRGYRFRFVGPRGNRFGSYGAELSLLFPVIAASIRRAETLAESVTARGFDPGFPRTFYPPLLMRAWERAAAAAVVLVACGFLVWRLGFHIHPAVGG